MDEVVAYLGRLADLMGLGDWELLVDSECDPEEADAKVGTVYGQKRAIISINPEWTGMKRAELRRVLVHELVHLHTARLGTTLLPFLGKAQVGVLEDAEEYMVDEIATAWARRLPLMRVTRA